MENSRPSLPALVSLLDAALPLPSPAVIIIFVLPHICFPCLLASLSCSFSSACTLNLLPSFLCCEWLLN